jgi:hypothetical protein
MINFIVGSIVFLSAFCFTVSLIKYLRRAEERQIAILDLLDRLVNLLKQKK